MIEQTERTKTATTVGRTKSVMVRLCILLLFGCDFLSRCKVELCTQE